VVTFLALLEMIRLKVIRVYQTGPFGDIRIYRRQVAADNAPHYDAAPGTPTAHD
jgi:chromatin segregation and condensation protein Rec8/ScpA/Scc1 (kleisin family)